MTPDWTGPEPQNTQLGKLGLAPAIGRDKKSVQRLASHDFSPNNVQSEL